MAIIAIWCFFIKIKNSFDEILSLGFDLGHLKMNTYYIKKVNFAKDYQNDSYNKNILMRKKLTR
jgi:hypothetical protein